LGYDAPVPDSPAPLNGPQNHRTVDRVTQILEEVAYRPGITFAELARALDAPKSSVHGFVRGLLAKAWLYEDGKRFFLGPALYGLTLVSGQIPAGSVSQADLEALHQATGVSVFLGVQAGDHLIYVSVAGTDAQTGFAARSNIRRGLLTTAGGKVILAERPDQERDAYLRRRSPQEAELVSQFLSELREIKRTHVAENFRHGGSQFALATIVRNQFGEVAAEITLVGASDEMLPRKDQLRQALLSHVAALSPEGARGRAAG
jgi:DNA-binding IclR family transcriptional regulator